MAETRSHWLDLFTGTTWNEFLEAGGEVSGFRESRWNTVKKIKPGDYFLCYVTGISRFIGILEVQGTAFKDDTPIWSIADFPCRIKVKVVIALDWETAVPIQELRNVLTIFQNTEKPHAWTGYVRGSPLKWSRADGEVVIQVITEAKENPVKRPVDEKKLWRVPTGLDTDIGTVTVPEKDEENKEELTTITQHTEMQYLLLKLGADMGFDTWVARNDPNRVIHGKSLQDHFTLKQSLPLQFDQATTKTIELIDVLWLMGNAIVSAFEVESTTSIYSGLLRMADLISMQPNLKIPLYLVAPDERRDKVFTEVNRPTFARLKPPLAEVCRYISFSALQQKLEEAGSLVKYMRPEFLDELAELCEVE